MISKNKSAMNSWPAIKISLIYAVIGAVWIIASDQVLAFLARDAEVITQLQTIKGWFYIIASAALLFWLINRQLKSIQENSERFQRWKESNFIGIYHSKADGEIIDVNNAFLNMLGYSEQDLQGGKLDWTKLTPNEFSYLDQRAIEEADEKGYWTPFEKEYFHKDGHRVPIFIGGSVFQKDSDEFIVFIIDLTERKKMENALQENESNLIQAQAISNTGNWKCNLVTGEVEGSEELLKIFGLENEELTLNNFASVVHPDDRDYHLKCIQNGIEQGVPWNVEHRILLKDGSIKWVQVIGEPQLDESGKTNSIVGIVRDTTEHKLHEEKIIASEKELSGILNSLQDVYFRANLDNNIIKISPSVEKTFGFRPDEMIGKQLSKLYVDPTGREKFLQVLKKANGTVFGYEAKVRDKKYGVRWASVNAHNVHDDMGAVIGIEGTLRDVSSKKKNEKELLRSNRSLQVLGNSSDLIVRAENETELLQGMCQIIEEILGYRLVWVGFVEHDKAKTVKPVTQVGYEEGYIEKIKLTWADTERGNGPAGIAIRSGKPCVINDINLDSRLEPWRQDAIERGYASVVALPLLQDKKAFAVLCIYATEVYSFNEEELNLLHKLVDDLAYGIVSLRSHEERDQLNKQLQQAQKMEAIGQLTGGIAHDFNNILASILGFTGLALQRFVKDDQPQLRDYLNEVSSAGERARDLVSQMLAFSRTDSSNVSLIELEPVIKEVIKMLQATLPSSIQLSSQIDKDVPAVIMDPVQLHQVLLNLCINARDAIGDKGRIDIQVKQIQIALNKTARGHICDACHHEIEEKHYIELSVHDSGTGISSDTLKQIFDPFFTTKEVGKGSGMGLSMVHGIVHQHGGHILVDTQSGKGTTFRLLLPKVTCVPIQETDAELEINYTTEVLNDAHILIVDDEESVARFMGDLLESRGAKVTVMTDSQVALDLFNQEPSAFDMVITDQTMPNITGAELAQKILILRPELPVILCTGYSEEMNEEKAIALGIRGYLKKPMEINEVIELVQSLLV